MNGLSLKDKMGEHARHFRLVSRKDIFNLKRKTYDQLDYLVYYSPQNRHNILQSMQMPIPQPLPPLTPTTISLYRRNCQPIFKTKYQQSLQLQGHMTYESLWIFASLDQKQFIDYISVAREFQRDLPLYLSANSKDIYEMAVTAAGNKILGKQPQIIRIVNKDPKQLWVLANHVFQSKISHIQLFPFVQSQNQFALQTVFELTVILQQVCHELMEHKAVLHSIMLAVNADSELVRKFSMRIIGNLAATRQAYIQVFQQTDLLDRLVINISCSNGDIRRDACWLLSNLCTKKKPATLIIQHTQLIVKLVELFAYQTLPHIKRQLTQLFGHLAHFADPKSALQLLGHPNVIQICYSQLSLQDPELNLVTLMLLRQLLQLGDSYKHDQGSNMFLCLMQQARSICNEIADKSYSQNSQISSVSLQIMAFLEEQDD